jgi:hypothetical protein
MATLVQLVYTSKLQDASGSAWRFSPTGTRLHFTTLTRQVAPQSEEEFEVLIPTSNIPLENPTGGATTPRDFREISELSFDLKEEVVWNAEFNAKVRVRGSGKVQVK